MATHEALKEQDGEISGEPRADIGGGTKTTAEQKTESIGDLNRQIAALKEKQAQIAKELERLCERKERHEAVGIIKDLFQRHVPLKTFYEDKVNVVGNETNKSISYTAAGVKISYHSRLTYHLGDYDTFVDTTVDVDGINVHTARWQ
jgi:hypothetical protein